MGCPVVRVGMSVGLALLALAALGMAPFAPTAAPVSLRPTMEERGKGFGKKVGEIPSGSVCFWSAQGPVCVERPVEAEAGRGPEELLVVLLAGPTAEERARDIWSAIPEGTVLERLEVRPDRTVVVYLEVPLGSLRVLDHATFEIIVNQIGWTLEPLRWRDLRIQTWDPAVEKFVPLAAFLPEVPAPRKETVIGGQEVPALSPAYVGQPPAPGQAQPQGALSGKTVYVSAGHGWQWSGTAWRVQRIPYPLPPYVGPIIEDHNNAEVVNQYLLRYLWNAGARVIPVRERDMNAAEVVVDNNDPGPGTGYFETGTWATAVITGTGYAGTNYRWSETVTGTPTAAAVWTATLPAGGEYAVYVWYRPGSDRAPDARYTIRHAGGETSVTVNQQHHGTTWHYIGSYGFRGGKEARITLSNQSSVTGHLVVADAVRFGGGTFDDLTGIETSAPYPPSKPWWEMAAYYYVQRMGMDQPPGDVTARPIYARWEHAGTGDDAVYVSWHTNGISGYQTHSRGTVSIIHNGEGLPITPGSEQLRDAIHAELIHDIQAGWDPGWTGYERSMNLGELRQLWDDDPTVRMPGTLIEVAYHDHPDDADVLKEPYFNMLAARAVYQGIVRYFGQRDEMDLTLLPEPPTHLAVENVPPSIPPSGGEERGGQVRVSWQPSPTDDLDLVGDPATGYQVYTSTDGVGWSNGVVVTATNVYTLAGLLPGPLLFVRVSATNDGGESFPTETLAVRVRSDAEVLLVNGFDRLNSTMLVSETDSVEGHNLRMFLDRMNRYDYVLQHGEAISYPFDSASNEAVRDGMVHLSDYVLVDWILGEESAPDETLDAAERALLADFLESGGALFLSGTEVGWHLDDLGGDPDFYNAYLRADYAGDDAETYEVAPAPGSIFEGVDPFRFDAPGMYDADYPDQLVPVSGSIAALTYSGGLTGTAAVQYDDGCERLVYFGFPFETIWPAQRPAVMGRVLDFLGLCLSPPVDTRIVTPADGSAYRTTPPFAGTVEVEETVTLDRVEVQVQRDSDGSYWTGSEWATGTALLTGTIWMPATIWVTGTESVSYESDAVMSWSYALPVLSDGDYHLRARAWTTDGEVDESPAEVAFAYDTLPPTSTVLITPTGGVHIPARVSVTLVWQPVGPDEGSPLAYLLALDGQFYTTTQSVYTLTCIASGLHTWGVQVFDAAGNRSGWVTDTFSVNLYTCCLPVLVRNFETGRGPCIDVLVNGGFESDEGWELNSLATYDTEQVHSGARSVRLGIPPGELGDYVCSSVAQMVRLSGDSLATLRLWLYPIGEGDDPEDRHYVGLSDQSGTYHSLDAWRSDARAWAQRVYDLSDYQGQTVTLYIGTLNDGDDDTAALYVDDVTLELCP